MPSRTVFAWIVLIAIQSAAAEERSIVVARRTTGGAIVTAPRAPERSVVVASREVPATKSSEQNPPAPLSTEKRRQAETKQLDAGEGTNRQIVVSIEMLEVSRTKLRRMGADVPDAPSKTANTKAVTAYTQWLKENRIAKVLAEPNLVVTSGRPGSFFVGGEIPLPSRGDSKKAVEFLKFGTEVDLLATAIGKEQVRMDLRIKVSELDESHAIEIDGTRIPGLTVRQCGLALSVACGETGMIEGPVATRTETVKTSDGQMKDQENEVLLLVAVTPEFVDAITPPESDTSKTSRN